MWCWTLNRTYLMFVSFSWKIIKWYLHYNSYGMVIKCHYSEYFGALISEVLKLDKFIQIIKSVRNATERNISNYLRYGSPRCFICIACKNILFLLTGSWHINSVKIMATYKSIYQTTTPTVWCKSSILYTVYLNLKLLWVSLYLKYLCVLN